jgi:glycosyltransferase involved in cell wall biosynthesis
MNLAFVGGLWFQPNVEGLFWFLRKVWPVVLESVPVATLTVTGRGASRVLEESLRGTVGVRYVGEVPEARCGYDGARGVVLPIRHGAGVKVKTVEALGSGLPCVGTVHAFDGLDVDRECCLMTDEPTQFAASCIDVLRNPDTGMKLGSRARAFTETNLTWTTVGRRYVAALDSLVSGIPIGNPSPTETEERLAAR